MAINFKIKDRYKVSIMIAGKILHMAENKVIMKTSPFFYE